MPWSGVVCLCQSALNLNSLIKFGLMISVQPICKLYPGRLRVSGSTGTAAGSRSDVGPNVEKGSLMLNVVVDVPEIKTVLVVGVFVHANDILTNVRGVREVER